MDRDLWSSAEQECDEPSVAAAAAEVEDPRHLPRQGLEQFGLARGPRAEAADPARVLGDLRLVLSLEPGIQNVDGVAKVEPVGGEEREPLARCLCQAAVSWWSVEARRTGRFMFRASPR